MRQKSHAAIRHSTHPLNGYVVTVGEQLHHLPALEADASLRRLSQGEGVAWRLGAKDAYLR